MGDLRQICYDGEEDFEESSDEGIGDVHCLEGNGAEDTQNNKRVWGYHHHPGEEPHIKRRKYYDVRDFYLGNAPGASDAVRGGIGVATATNKHNCTALKHCYVNDRESRPTIAMLLIEVRSALREIRSMLELA